MTPSRAPIDQARQVMRLMPRLYRWAVASALQLNPDQELSLRQLSALQGIREGISSPGELARRLRVTPAVVTGLLDRLERRGYVRREVDAEDRRRLRLALTDSGRAVGDAVGQALTEALAAELGKASRAELEELGRAVTVLERTLGALEARTPTDETPAWDAPDEEDWEQAPGRRKAAASRAPGATPARRAPPRGKTLRRR